VVFHLLLPHALVPQHNRLAGEAVCSLAIAPPAREVAPQNSGSLAGCLVISLTVVNVSDLMAVSCDPSSVLTPPVRVSIPVYQWSRKSLAQNLDPAYD
jgi:hypothetical protein